jgi:hypothetical protein
MLRLTCAALKSSFNQSCFFFGLQLDPKACTFSSLYRNVL